MGHYLFNVNPYLPSGPVHPYQLDKSISIFRGVWCTFFIFFFWMKFLYANSVDPYQTPCSAASDLGLHCLPRFQKGDARFIWVKSMLFKVNFISDFASLPQEDQDKYNSLVDTGRYTVCPCQFSVCFCIICLSVCLCPSAVCLFIRLSVWMCFRLFVGK